jgi:hypothetical protein
MKRILCAACLSLPLLAGAQSNSSGASRPADRPKEIQTKAVERCKANRGVDCDTPEGLKEWQLLERSRREAIKDGSRHRLPQR